MAQTERGLLVLVPTSAFFCRRLLPTEAYRSSLNLYHLLKTRRAQINHGLTACVFRCLRCLCALLPIILVELICTYSRMYRLKLNRSRATRFQFRRWFTFDAIVFVGFLFCLLLCRFQLPFTSRRVSHSLKFHPPNNTFSRLWWRYTNTNTHVHILFVVDLFFAFALLPSKKPIKFVVNH